MSRIIARLTENNRRKENNQSLVLSKSNLQLLKGKFGDFEIMIESGLDSGKMANLPRSHFDIYVEKDGYLNFLVTKEFDLRLLLFRLREPPKDDYCVEIWHQD
jgi:hypothetical protein